ncbi:helix-turn-helix domain-containing protein [Legionella impletisoli]|uniref:Transcriptional regulator n=1 Tax=Legionella impletisoli TaxID=343510 RepID=A0A917JSE9_9GAMM|nr:helix-turn-helix transcriptional regulator [Legionella impletisoli]GGI84052.1 transcriptional regulator [Legionella impletisoli]
MEKNDLSKQFANRLHDALISAGFHSKRSTSGVDIHSLAEITGYSSQICRKYLRGEAIPEPSKLIEIAKYLNTSPGWLLFGDPKKDDASSEQLTVRKALLHYIFTKANALYLTSDSPNEVAHFLMDLILDVSQIEASEEQTKKIIDIALASAKHFQGS